MLFLPIKSSFSISFEISCFIFLVFKIFVVGLFSFKKTSYRFFCSLNWNGKTTIFELFFCKKMKKLKKIKKNEKIEKMEKIENYKSETLRK